MAEQPTFRAFVFHLFAERIALLMQLVEEVAFARLDRRLAFTKLLLAKRRRRAGRHPPATGRRNWVACGRSSAACSMGLPPRDW